MRTQAILLGVLVVAGCGEGGGSTEGTGGTGGTGASTGEPTSGTGATTSEPVTTTTSEPTTGDSSTTGAGESSGTSGGSETTDTTGDPGSTGEAIDCEAISAEPSAPTLFLSGFKGSEDLAFDGLGGLALKRDGAIVLVRADQSETVLAQGLPQAYGTRFLADGRLLVALPQSGEVITYDAQGQQGAFLGGLKSPNGLYPDGEGNVWISEFGGSRVLRIGADLTMTTIVSGTEASSANGVVYDPQRGMVFYSNYQAGRILRVAIDEMDKPGAPVLVAGIAGAALDGLTLDVCGNLYAVDQKTSRLYRLRLDGLGATIDEPALLAQFPSNVANAQFGVGDGFDPHTLYVAGNPGDVYTLVVEFPGAAIVTVE